MQLRFPTYINKTYNPNGEVKVLNTERWSLNILLNSNLNFTWRYMID